MDGLCVSTAETENTQTFTGAEQRGKSCCCNCGRLGYGTSWIIIHMAVTWTLAAMKNNHNIWFMAYKLLNKYELHRLSTDPTCSHKKSLYLKVYSIIFNCRGYSKDRECRLLDRCALVRLTLRHCGQKLDPVLLYLRLSCVLVCSA
jgi:hypothetical protein